MDKEVDSFISDLELLVQCGNLGNFTHCRVDQVVLIFKDNSLLNYFTHVDFSSYYTEENEIIPITCRPISITDEYKVGVFSGYLSIDAIKNILRIAVNEGVWKYNNHEVILDEVFPTKKKFIPEYSPLNRYNSFVPIEYGLYGSNFMGGYYIHELFSPKTKLSSIVNIDAINTILKLIKSVKLNYRLDKLTDRIGSVVCKFNIDVLRKAPKKLGDFGIEYEFSLEGYANTTHTYTLQVLQEFDEMIYENYIDSHFEFKTLMIEPNQSKTKVFVLDNMSGLILFGYVQDNTKYSDYYSQLNPSTLLSGTAPSRKLHFPDHDEFVELSGVQFLGSMSLSVEMDDASRRKRYLDDKWFQERGYVSTYVSHEHEKAIKDINRLISENLVWDLEELWIIDPYLSSDDIIETGLRCKKQGIHIKCLCSFSALHGNIETKVSMNAEDYTTFKKAAEEKLHNILTNDTDVKLEYRSVRNGYGITFHDRYIVLLYGLNRARVWTLGASINSIGKSHSIIQIVHTPELVVSILRELWKSANNKDCIIFDNVIHLDEDEHA